MTEASDIRAKRTRFRWFFAASLTFALATASAEAFAQQQPTLADRETARALMDEGDKKRDGGDLKGALKSYEAADAIMKVPTTGLDVARTQAALGLLLEARETLARVIRIPVKPNEPAPFTAARKAADALNEDLAARIPSIQVAVTGADDAHPPQVVVDGETIPLAAANAPRKVNPGKHVVVVKAGANEQRQEVTLAERETKTVAIDVREPPPPSQKTEPVPERPPSPSSTPRLLMYGGFGVAAAGVGVGTITGLISLSKAGDLNDACPNKKCAPAKQDDIDSTKGLGNVATVAFVVGGIGAAVGVAGLVLSRRQKDTTATAKVSPVIAPSYLGLRGTF